MEVKLSKTIMFRRGNGEVETVFTVAEQSRASLAAAWEAGREKREAKKM